MSYNKILTLKKLKGSDKQAYLKNCSNDEWVCKFLYYLLNPMLTYNISEKTLDKLNLTHTNRCDLIATKLLYDNIFEWCEYLASFRGLSSAVIENLNVFLHTKCTHDERELYKQLLSKTLKIGINIKTVNKCIPGLIPEWEVQQAFPIDKYPIKPNTEFWLTQKLNGVRATFYKGRLYSRSGVPYKGLDDIICHIGQTPMSEYVLDGELTLKNKSGISDNEAFRITTGILNSDSKNKKEICYTVFDIIPIEDFDSSSPKINYSDRRSLLNIINNTSELLKEFDNLRILPVLYHGQDQSVIYEFLNKMIVEDKEGLILNTNVPYKRTRHRGILKIKRFYTMDLPILRLEEGLGRLHGTLGALVLKYKSNEVKVGSGFSDEQRNIFWKHKNELVNMLCEVKYKEVSRDKNTGLESLQFPVFVRLRIDKNDVSYG